jgi:hypothetical protein
METYLRKSVTAFAIAAGISSICLPATAEDTFDPLSGKSILAFAEKTAINQGTGVLTNMGKKFLAYALDAYAPGLSQIFGLSGEDTQTQKVIAAIAADGAQTRSMILDYWDWARAQNAALINAEYAAVEVEINSWNALPVNSRLTNRDRLAPLIHDCVSVMAKFQTAPDAAARIDYLHAYMVLLNLTIALESELSELEIIGDAWATSGSGMTPANWWNSLSSASRDSITASIANTKLLRVEALLLPGLEVSFADQMTAMDEGTLTGGVPGVSDFVRARDWQFSSLSWAGGGGQSTWVYYVGRDPQGNCANGSRYCKAYFISQGPTNSPNGPTYYVDFDGGSGPYYPNANAAYQEHKALALKDMIVRGYGPVRAFAENWWDVWRFGARDRIGLDDALDAYIATADAELHGHLRLLATYQTKNITPAQMSYLSGFAVAHGLDSIGAISDTAFMNPDYLDTPHALSIGWLSVNVTQFPWWLHLNSQRAWPRTDEQLTRMYRGLPAAKLAALL